MSKKKSSFKVPAKESTMVHPPAAVPFTVQVGKLVLFETRHTGDAAVMTGWIIQNSMSQGGQTKSYLVLPYLDAVEDEPEVDGFVTTVRGTEPYSIPIRIRDSKIIAVLEPELP